MIAGRLSTTNLFTMAPVSVVMLMGLGSGLLSLHAVDKRDTQQVQMIQTVSVNATKYTDCLWCVARNHGFYMIQRDVTMNQSDEMSHRLWEAFVRGMWSSKVSSIALASALARSIESADAHFLSSQ